jgi:hypothetical protein
MPKNDPVNLNATMNETKTVLIVLPSNGAITNVLFAFKLFIVESFCYWR